MNPARGEAALVIGGKSYTLRPSFEALVAAEEELGSLFALVERASNGQLKLAEMACLFWHCLVAQPENVSREKVGAAIAEAGLVKTTPVLKLLLSQILQGRV